MSDQVEEKTLEKVVEKAVVADNGGGTKGVVVGTEYFKMEAYEHQGKLHIRTFCTKVPLKLYAQVYLNGFPANPNTGYESSYQITKIGTDWNTGLDWGEGYSCALILDTYDSYYAYQYVCKYTT